MNTVSSISNNDNVIVTMVFITLVIISNIIVTTGTRSILFVGSSWREDHVALVIDANSLTIPSRPPAAPGGAASPSSAPRAPGPPKYGNILNKQKELKRNVVITRADVEIH